MQHMCNVFNKVNVNQDTTIYDQIDGVVFGSPLAPLLANLIMGDHERLWLQDFTSFNVLFYVEDTFYLFFVCLTQSVVLLCFFQ